MSNDDVSKPHYIVAVSGGVDSVVLLDMLQRYSVGPLVVAHVDHGIRRESADDAQFVRELAEKYHLPFECLQLKLGFGASENAAREARYDFLRILAKKYGGPIVTAHHADDVVETIILHLQRGTGWRGLAVMSAEDVHRPLTSYFKEEIIDYARRRSLQWREDSTNSDTVYARNRIRPLVMGLERETKLEFLALWADQRNKAEQIDTHLKGLVTQERYFYIMSPPLVAREVLRATLLQAGVSRTRPQLDALLLACKTAQIGTEWSAGRDYKVVFSKSAFRILPCKKK